MTDENAIKKYNHLNNIINGTIKTGNAVRNALMVSDAERHLADLVKKRPNIVFERPVQPVAQPKSKDKK